MRTISFRMIGRDDRIFRTRFFIEYRLLRNGALNRSAHTLKLRSNKLFVNSWNRPPAIIFPLSVIRPGSKPSIGSCETKCISRCENPPQQRSSLNVSAKSVLSPTLQMPSHANLMEFSLPTAKAHQHIRRDDKSLCHCRHFRPSCRSCRSCHPCLRWHAISSSHETKTTM